MASVEVPGTSNIFGAGIAEPPAPAGGGGGTQPPCMSIPRGTSTIDFDATGRVYFEALRFDTPSQFHRCAGGPEVTAPISGPDGPSVGGCTTTPGNTLYLLGRRHLGDLVASWRWLPGRRSSAGHPPRGLLLRRASTSDATTTSWHCAPRCVRRSSSATDIRAMGRCSGSMCPQERARVYLGFTDAWGFRHDPGYYGDNSGSLEVNMRRRSPKFAEPKPGDNHRLCAARPS